MWRALLRDLAGVAALAALSFGVGLGLNRLRAEPLSLVYLSPQERLESQLTGLVNAPPLKLDELQTVGLAEFRRLVEQHGALILDARSSIFYREGHVPDALSLSREGFARDYRRLSSRLGAPDDKPIVVYCSGADCHDSRLVASALVALGFTQVRVFTGGWEAWTEADLPIAR